MFWLILKNRKIIAFVSAIILLAAMLTYHRVTLNASVKRANAAMAELSDYKTEQQFEFAKSEAINQAKLENANRNLKVVNESYQAALEKVRLDYAKKQNETTKKLDAANFNITDLRGMLRDQISRDITTTNETAADSEGNPEYWRERHGTAAKQYENLRQACIITTLDFNALSGWRDEVCAMAACY